MVRQPKFSIRFEDVFTGTGKKKLFAVRINASSPIAEFKTRKEAMLFVRKLRRRI